MNKINSQNIILDSFDVENKIKRIKIKLKINANAGDGAAENICNTQSEADDDDTAADDRK